MIRPDKFAGIFYQRDFSKLQSEIKDCFTSKLGPGDLPVTKRNNQLLPAIIAPHAAYQFSGSCAAWAYKDVAEHKLPKTYIILGPSHQGFKGLITTDNLTWKTPFGTVNSNQEIISKLVREAHATKQNSPFFDEHSIEVQLPFLQFVSMQDRKNLNIVPVLVSVDSIKKIEQFADVLSKIDNITVICSTDFTHYGPNYNYEPFVYNKKEELKNWDKAAIKPILEGNVTGFIKYLEKTNSTICGYQAILATMFYTNSKGKLLQYYNSASLTKDYNNSVGYASIKFD